MSTSRYETNGWYLVCEKKTNGKQEGRAACSKNKNHRFNIYHDTKFCPICGAPVEREQEDRYTSFIDVYEREEYLGEELCIELEQQFDLVPIEQEDEMDILIPTMDGLFEFDAEEDGYSDCLTEIDPTSIKTNWDEQRFLIEKAVQKLTPLYDNIEIKFGRVVYWA